MRQKVMWAIVCTMGQTIRKGAGSSRCSGFPNPPWSPGSHTFLLQHEPAAQWQILILSVCVLWVMRDRERVRRTERCKICAYDKSFCTSLLHATLLPRQSQFTLYRVQRETNLKLPYIGNGKAYPSICITKLVTDKKLETILFLRPLSRCLAAAPSLGWFLSSHFVSNFIKTSNTCTALHREENNLERGVVRLTLVLKSNTKNKLHRHHSQHKCYYLVERIVWLPLACHSTLIFGTGIICLSIDLSAIARTHWE